MSSARERQRKPVTILVADDDAEDRAMIGDAFHQSQLGNDLRFVGDGEELIEYLFRRGLYKDPQNSPRPGLIILDMKMPKKDGREVLRELRNDPSLRSIPVVVLTTSNIEEDVQSIYDLGANSYVTKPRNFASLVAITKELCRYWFEIVELPKAPTEEGGNR